MINMAYNKCCGVEDVLLQCKVRLPQLPEPALGTLGEARYLVVFILLKFC